MLAHQRLFPPAVPALVEAATIALDPLARALVRRVAGAGAEVEEERLLRLRRPQVPHELDGVVDEVLGEMIPVLPASGRRGAVVIVQQGRGELVRLAAEEPVEALEAPAQRPAGPRRAQVVLVLRRQVPLADGVRGIALLNKHL